MDLTVKDAARLLHTSEKALYRWIHDGTLPCYRVNEKYRLNRVQLLEWATQRQMTVSPEIFAEDEEPLPHRLLADALHRGGIIYDLAGSDKRSVLHAVCQQLPLPEGVDREELYNVLLVREALGSTAIGHGIAIPHPRGPIVLGVKDPTVTLAFLKQPIDFGALDGRPVSVLFVIISTTIRLHLQLLSHLMFVLQNTTFRAMLQSRPPAAMLQERLEDVLSHLGAAEGGEGARS